MAGLNFVAQAAENLETTVGALAAAVTVAAASVLATHLGDVAVAAVPVAAALPAAVEPATTPWGHVGPVLGAVATGIGVVGFVTFVGGVILWARLRAAGFPAEPALSIVPAQDLLVIGAVTLVPEVLWGLAAVALLFLVRAGWGLMRGQMSSADAALVEQQAPRLTALATGAYVLFALAGALIPNLDELAGLWQSVQFIGLGLLLAVLSATVARITPSFLFQATATFLSVGLFLSFLAYARARNVNEVRGAAVIRENKKATVGFFVAEGADRVYIARVNLEMGMTIVEDRSRLVGIAKDQVSDIGIGSPKPPNEAIRQGKALAAELCALQPQIAAQAKTDETTSEEQEGSAEQQPPREDCWTAPPGEPQRPRSE